jgi:hypothetical protein
MLRVAADGNFLWKYKTGPPRGLAQACLRWITVREPNPIRR